MNKNQLKESISGFPTGPGVYLMKNEEGRIIYVGKARNLRNRVRSYFSKGRDIKTSALVRNISGIDFVLTDNEFEALILENNLIKEHNPRYNINLKDGKTYPVIRITADEFPRIFRTRRIIRDGSDYFGPFADVKAIDSYMEVVDRLFPLRKCKGPLKKRSSPCLYYHINKCPGPCAGLISREDYATRVDEIRKFIGGTPDSVKKDLENRMKTASEELRFERAAELRDSLRAIETIESNQLVNDFDPESRDYIACHEHEGLISFVAFQMRQGRLVGTDIFRNRVYLVSNEDIDDALEQFVIRYYQEMRRPPVRLFTSLGEDRSAHLQKFFKGELGAEVLVSMPASRRDASLLQMAQENARQDSFKRAREMGDEEGIAELQKVLRLPALPRRIEGFDIAQLHGKHTVAAMVSFRNGIPDKREYRSYSIRSLKGKIDDYESIREAVARRYSRLLNENLPMPDLILIDGGKGQLNAACEILESLNLRGIPVLSLAKREEEIFLPGRSQGVVLPEGTPALRILQAVRDEAHRFGTSINQRQRNRDLELEARQIPGFGEKRSQQLLVEFGSYRNAAEAGAGEISSRAGIPLKVAESFVEYFIQNGGDLPQKDDDQDGEEDGLQE